MSDAGDICLGMRHPARIYRIEPTQRALRVLRLDGRYLFVHVHSAEKPEEDETAPFLGDHPHLVWGDSTVRGRSGDGGEFGDGQSEMNTGPGRAGVEPDATAMSLDERPAQRQPDAEPFFLG